MYLDDKCKNLSVEKGSSAEKQGLQANDKIIKINRPKYKWRCKKLVEIIFNKRSKNNDINDSKKKNN